MKKKNIVIMLATAFIVLGATNIFAAPNDPVSPLIHIGAGDQVTTKLNVGSSTIPGTLFDASESGKNSVFDGSTVAATDADASLFTVLQNGWLQNMLFLGRNTISWLNEFGSPVSDPINSNETQASSSLSVWLYNFTTAGVTDLQKINVFGGLISTDFDLAAGNTSGNMQVCVDSIGGFIPCP